MSAEETISSLELSQETAFVTKRDVSTGTIRVQTITRTDEETVAVDLTGTQVHVTRVPVDRIVDVVPDTRVEDGVTIVPVFEEEVVVERRIRLVEELHIWTQTTTRTTELTVALRKQDAVVERRPIEPQNEPCNKE